MSGEAETAPVPLTDEIDEILQVIDEALEDIELPQTEDGDGDAG